MEQNTNELKQNAMELSASCSIGAEKVLYNELEQLQLRPISKSPGRVNFYADNKGLATVLVNSRTADRLFLVLARFHAADFDELYEGCNAVQWERWIHKTDKLLIEKARSFSSKLSSQRALQAICQKAAYDRLCKVYKQALMPESGQIVAARIRIERDIAVLELDLCGEALSKRGYRKIPTEAPLKESLAAAILYLTGWRGSFVLYDPFCGSGTIVIEAALMALGLAPGLKRSFLWEGMPDGSKEAVLLAKEAARAKINMDRDISVHASDVNPMAIEAAVYNAGLAGLKDHIRFFEARAESTQPFADRGFIVTDPPYGKRLGKQEEIEALYSSLSYFAERFSAWDMCFIVEDENFPEYFVNNSKLKNASWKKTKINDGAEIRYLQRLFIARNHHI